jgi:alpha-beta hydrolase superfamily lysophospholipase
MKHQDPQRQWEESEFFSFDQEKIFFRYSRPQNPHSKKSLLILHRGHEHSGRVKEIAENLGYEDFWCFAFDLRGHGRSGGQRAWAKDFKTWVRDLDCFAKFIQREFPLQEGEQMVIANSVASVMTVSWILNFAPKIKGCILGAPAFSIKLYVPFALSGLKFLRCLGDKFFVTSYVKSSLLTRDEKQAKAYDEDPLITKKIGVNVLVDLFKTAKIILQRAPDFEVPVLILSAEKDFIVKNKFQKIFYERISSKEKRFIRLDNFRHAIFHESEREKVLQPMREFINKQFAEPVYLPAVIPQERLHTMLEFQQLATGPSGFKALYYGTFRFLMKSLGRSSKGIKLGLEHGFNSGSSLDYVYRNQAQGKWLVGAWIDRAYLNSVGWRGIRKRKENLKKTLHGLIEMNPKKSLKIFDLAAGGASYLYEIKKESKKQIRLYINDLDPQSLKQAQGNLRDYTFAKEEIVFSQEDAYQLEDLKFAEHERPDILIVSGLFELNAQNFHILKSLIKLHQQSAPGAQLLYTAQPWHPQLGMIAHVLHDRFKRPWVMRRRIQSEMDQLIESAGFRKTSTESDDEGIFTVSHAQKKN